MTQPTQPMRARRLATNDLVGVPGFGNYGTPAGAPTPAETPKTAVFSTPASGATPASASEVTPASGASSPAATPATARMPQATPSADASLVVTDLHIAFPQVGGGEVVIADGLSFTAKQGQLVLFSGRSGCGKTTILRALTGLLKPNDGEITWWGESLTSMKEKQIRQLRLHRFGLLDQSSTMVETMTALENVMLPVMGAKRAVRKEARTRAEALLSEFGLENRFGAFSDTLSGGERQRVVLARALLTKPDVLVVDEPTSSLDTSWGENIIEHLRNYADQGHLVLLSSHDSRFHGICDQVFRLTD